MILSPVRELTPLLGLLVKYPAAAWSCCYPVAGIAQVTPTARTVSMDARYRGF